MFFRQAHLFRSVKIRSFPAEPLPILHSLHLKVKGTPFPIGVADGRPTPPIFFFSAVSFFPPI